QLLWRYNTHSKVVGFIDCLDEDHRKTKAATKDATSAGRPMHRTPKERSFCALVNDACQTPFASRVDARRLAVSMRKESLTRAFPQEFCAVKIRSGSPSQRLAI